MKQHIILLILFLVAFQSQLNAQELFLEVGSNMTAPSRSFASDSSFQFGFNTGIGYLKKIKAMKFGLALNYNRIKYGGVYMKNESSNDFIVINLMFRRYFLKGKIQPWLGLDAKYGMCFRQKHVGIQFSFDQVHAPTLYYETTHFGFIDNSFKLSQFAGMGLNLGVSFDTKRITYSMKSSANILVNLIEKSTLYVNDQPYYALDFSISYKLK